MFKRSLFLLLCFAIINCSLTTKNLSQGSRKMLEEKKIDISGQWEPIRIVFDSVKEEDFEVKSVLDTIFSIAGVFFQKHLLVRRLGEKLTLPNYVVDDSDIPSRKLTIQYDADLVIFVFISNNGSDSTLASCGPLRLDTNTNRPIFATMKWNIAHTKQHLSNVQFEEQLATAVHEIIHGLGFVKKLFNRFYDSVNGEFYSKEIIMEDSVVMLNTPRIIAQAQKHFGCSDITQIPMENEGGQGTAGSHWERALFYNEMMTGSDMVASFAMTDFTFQFLQDTGFYRISTYDPDILTWGQNQGCSFFKDQCKGGQFKEFCESEGEQGCQITQYGIGTCATDQLSNNCKYYQVSPALDCMDAKSFGYTDNTETFQYFGFQSMCIQGGFSSFSSTPHQQSCYKFSCIEKDILLLNVGGQTINCTEGGNKTLNGSFGNITCPDNIQQFCANEDDCPNQCNQRGFCMKGLCTCGGDYYGVGCEYEGCATVRNGKDCVSTCPTGQYHNTNINYCIGCPGNCATCSAYNVCTTCNQGYELRGGFCDFLSYTPKAMSNDSNNNLGLIVGLSVSIPLLIIVVVFLLYIWNRHSNREQPAPP